MARAERPKKDLSTKGNYSCQKKLYIEIYMETF